MTFFWTMRTCILKAMPILLAAIACALVLLFFPILSFFDKKPQTRPHTSPIPVTISTIQIGSEASDIHMTTQLPRRRTSVTTPIALPLPPSAPPSTPELQIKPPPSTHEKALPTHEDNAYSQDITASTDMQDTQLYDASNTDNIGADDVNDNDLNTQKGNPPILLKKVEPYYPERSRRLGQEGYVIVQFEVDANGRVKNPTVNHAEPTGHFERAALNAVRQWRFHAAKDEAGHPVEYRLQLRIDFRLHTK